MKYETFHYDMDGVLVDSEPTHVAAERETCEHFGLDIDVATWDGMKGKTARDIFESLYWQHAEKHGLSETPSVDEMVRHKTNKFLKLIADGAILPVDGAEELLEWTKNHGTGQGLVTSSNRLVTTAILHRFDWRKLFDVVVTGNDVRIGKPHPGPYLKSLRLLDARRETALAFEDSKNGLRSAIAAKIGSMAITSSYHSRDDFSKLNPTYVVDSWYDAPRIIEAS